MLLLLFDLLYSLHILLLLSTTIPSQEMLFVMDIRVSLKKGAKVFQVGILLVSSIVTIDNHAFCIFDGFSDFIGGHI